VVRYRPPVKTEMSVVKRFECPGCGCEIESRFDGRTVRFFYGGREFASCGGLYETVEIPCPRCKGLLIFDKVEVESGEVSVP
jgi:hypothetical protein